MIRFKLTDDIKDSLTWDDLEVLESGKIGAAKNILARYMVDEQDKNVPLEHAKKQLGALKISQIEKVMQDFMKLMTNTALNPPTAAS